MPNVRTPVVFTRSKMQPRVGIAALVATMTVSGAPPRRGDGGDLDSGPLCCPISEIAAAGAWSR